MPHPYGCNILQLFTPKRVVEISVWDEHVYFFVWEKYILPAMLFPTLRPPWEIPKLRKHMEPAATLVQAKVGPYGSLWYLRPKVHMFEHVLRDCN